jgi:phage repressor protein C with HTH and peptisase S24 domain
MGTGLISEELDRTRAQRLPRYMAALFELAQQSKHARLRTRTHGTANFLHAWHGSCAGKMSFDGVEAGTLLLRQPCLGQPGGKILRGVHFGPLNCGEAIITEMGMMSTYSVLEYNVPVLFTLTMNNIGKLRHARGMSQQQLADKLNTTAVSIGRYEREDQRLSLPLLRRFAKVFDVTIGEIAGETRLTPDYLSVPVFDLRAAAGAGALAEDRDPAGHLMFREQWLRRMASDIHRLFVLEISGDSMWETLHDGDHALVDPSQTNPRREGLYVIRIDDMLQVKRISMHPVTKLLTVKSDNPAYRSFDNIKPDEIAIMGRVIWIGRSLG